MENLKNIEHRISVLEAYIAKEINRKQASIRLGISESHVSVLKKKYLHSGREALLHGNIGREPSSKKSVFVELDAQIRQNLDFILALHHIKSILSGNTISHKNKQYLPIKPDGGILVLPVKTKVTLVETYKHQVIAILYNGDYYEPKQVADVGGRFSMSPGDDHPWKKFRYGKAAKNVR